MSVYVAQRDDARIFHAKSVCGGRSRLLERAEAPEGMRPCFRCYPDARKLRPVVYFARTDAGLIKIGCSGDVETRIATLRHSWACKGLTLIAAIPGSYEMERAVHSVFSDERVMFELFKASPRLMAYIEGIPAQAVAA